MDAAALPSTIAEVAECESVVQRSRFIARAVPLGEDAMPLEDVVADARRQYRGANHHCTAQVTGLNGESARSSDDGEPAGTAGAPMLEVLRRRGLTDVGVVVTRYFGGVKLGSGGLARAYGAAVAEVLDLCVLVAREWRTQMIVTTPHSEAGRMDHALRVWAARCATSVETRHQAVVAEFTLWVRPAEQDSLAAAAASASAGSAATAVGETRIVGVRRD